MKGKHFWWSQLTSHSNPVLLFSRPFSMVQSYSYWRRKTAAVVPSAVQQYLPCRDCGTTSTPQCKRQYRQTSGRHSVEHGPRRRLWWSGAAARLWSGLAWPPPALLGQKLTVDLGILSSLKQQNCQGEHCTGIPLASRDPEESGNVFTIKVN